MKEKMAKEKGKKAKVLAYEIEWKISRAHLLFKWLVHQRQQQQQQQKQRQQMRYK